MIAEAEKEADNLYDKQNRLIKKHSELKEKIFEYFGLKTNPE
jgi:hypothetical protein